MCKPAGKKKQLVKKKKKKGGEASQVSTFLCVSTNQPQGWDHRSLVIRMEEDMGTEMG